MNRFVPLILLSAGILAFATVFLVIVPAAEIRTIEAPEGLAPYTEAEPRAAHITSIWAASIATRSSRAARPRVPTCSAARVAPQPRPTTSTTRRICWARCGPARTF